MKVNRFKIDGKMLRISVKTFNKLSGLSEWFGSFEQKSSKSSINSNLSSTSTDQTLNEINDSNSKYFESSKTFTFTSTNRIFNLNSTNTTKAFEIFDDSIEIIDFVSKKIDFAEKKATQFSSNIASKNAKETTRKRKANKLFILSRKISNSTKIVMNINDAIDNETKYLMYTLNLTNSNYKSQIQHLLNQLNQLKIDNSTNENSNANLNANANSIANASFHQKINTDIEMKNAQIEQNHQQKPKRIMKSRIEKSIDAKLKKI